MAMFAATIMTAFAGVSEVTTRVVGGNASTYDDIWEIACDPQSNLSVAYESAGKKHLSCFAWNWLGSFEARCLGKAQNEDDRKKAEKTLGEFAVYSLDFLAKCPAEHGRWPT